MSELKETEVSSSPRLTADEAITRKRRYLFGRPVVTVGEMKEMSCPFPPEPEWIEEALKIRAEQSRDKK